MNQSDYIEPEKFCMIKPQKTKLNKNLKKQTNNTGLFYSHYNVLISTIRSFFPIFIRGHCEVQSK